MSDAEENTPLSRGFIAGAAVIALVVIAFIIVLTARLGGGSDGDDEGGVPASPEASSSSRCGLPDGRQGSPASGPEAEWTLAGRFAVPSNEEFGPADEENGVSVCFARSPTGALFSAVNYLGDSIDPGIESDDFVRARVLMDERGQALLEQPSADDSDAPPLQLAGYRILDETSDRATVEMAVRSSEGSSAGQLFSITLTMTWSEGDWRVAVPATGVPPASALLSLSGFVEWSGA